MDQQELLELIGVSKIVKIAGRQRDFHREGNQDNCFLLSLIDAYLMKVMYSILYVSHFAFLKLFKMN